MYGGFLITRGLRKFFESIFGFDSRLCFFLLGGSGIFVYFLSYSEFIYKMEIVMIFVLWGYREIVK